MAKTGKGTGHQTKEGHQHIGEADERLTQSDLASEIQGTNRLQGDDQSHVRNQRRVAPKVGGASGKGSQARVDNRKQEKV